MSWCQQIEPCLSHLKIVCLGSHYKGYCHSRSQYWKCWGEGGFAQLYFISLPFKMWFMQLCLQRHRDCRLRKWSHLADMWCRREDEGMIGQSDREHQFGCEMIAGSLAIFSLQYWDTFPSPVPFAGFVSNDLQCTKHWDYIYTVGWFRRNLNLFLWFHGNVKKTPKTSEGRILKTLTWVFSVFCTLTLIAQLKWYAMCLK